MNFFSRLKSATSIVFNGATTTTAQRSRSNILRDTKRELNPSEWRSMTSFCNQLYAQMGEIKGAIREKATYVVGDAWHPQFYGKDKAFGEQLEAFLWEWMKIADVRGYPYSFQKGLELSSIAMDRSGDIGVILVRGTNNYPQIQYVAGHRIGSRNIGEQLVTDGPYKGLPIYNGVIMNLNMRAVAYKVLGDLIDGTEDKIISARDMFLIYDPDWSDQPRGISTLYHAVQKLQDLQDIHGYTMQGLKMAATTGLIETNEDGEASVQGESRTTTGGDGTGTVIEDLLGGTTRIYKAGTGSKLETLKDDRPSANSQEFYEQTLRAAYQGMEWSYEITRNAAALGGNPMRVILAKCGRTVEKRQCLLRTAAARMAGFAVAKAIQNGDLPPNDEWWKIDFQMPRLLTGDAGREAQQDREDLKAGNRSLQEDAAERGVDWLELRDQIELEANDVLVRAKRLSDSTGVPIEIALNLLQQRTPNGNLPISQPAAEPAKQTP